MHAEEYPRLDFNEVMETTIRLLEEYNITFEGRSRIFVDGINPSFIRALREAVDENENYEKQIAHYKCDYSTASDLNF